MKLITPFYFSIKNLQQKPFRTVVIIFSVVIATALLFTGTVIIKGIENSTSVGMKRLGADIMVVPEGFEAQVKTALIWGGLSSFYMPAKVAEKISVIEGVKAVSSQLFVVTAPYSCCDVPDTIISAFDPETDITITPWLKDKKMSGLKTDEIIIGSEFPRNKGKFVQLYGSQYKVVDKLEPTGMPFFDDSVFISFEGAHRMINDSKTKKGTIPINIPPNHISVVLVQLQPDAYAQKIAILIEAGIEKVGAIIAEEVITSVRKQLVLILNAALILSAGVWLMVVLMLSAGFSMITNERKREIGLLRAMGASRSYIFKSLIYEAALKTLSGGALGVISGIFVISMFEKLMLAPLKIPYLLPQTDFIMMLAVICIGIALISGVVAALYPAIKSSRLAPYEAVRGGE